MKKDLNYIENPPKSSCGIKAIINPIVNDNMMRVGNSERVYIILKWFGFRKINWA